jgi:hypothetical protein
MLYGLWDLLRTWWRWGGLGKRPRVSWRVPRPRERYRRGGF